MKKNAVMLADTRPALIGHVLLQIKETNPNLFDEAIIYHIGLSENDMKIMNSIMPCRFILYKPAFPETVLQKERFRAFSVLMFARYEMFHYLSEFKTITWLDTDILIQGSLQGLLDKSHKTGLGLICEDPINKTSNNSDYMRTCFTSNLTEYNMNAYLYCSGTIVLTNKLILEQDYSDWCYSKTIEWCNILSLPDQGVINALVQQFRLPVTPLRGNEYCCFPYYKRNCDHAFILHSWGVNKFWSDWYLYKMFPKWGMFYDKWLSYGGSPLPQEIEPKISVLIPVYKPNLKHFRKCLESLIMQRQDHGQRFSNFEILIIAEPVQQEELAPFVASFGDPRICLEFNTERLGIAASLNKGLRMAKGSYIARMDDDDISNEFRLYKQAKYLDVNGKITLCTSDFEYFGDMNERRVSFDGEMSRAWSIFTCPFDHPTIMFRKSFIIENSLYYDESRTHVEDWELWLRAFSCGMQVGSIHEVLFYHRWYNGSAGQTNKTINMMRELVVKNFLELNVKIPLEDIPYVGPWNGKTDEQQYIRLKQLFDDALNSNSKLRLYDQQALVKAFSLRLEEAQSGKLSEIAFPISVTKGDIIVRKPNLLRRIIKRILKPLYQPIRYRFEDRIVHTEQLVVQSAETLAQLQIEQAKIAGAVTDSLAQLQIEQAKIAKAITQLSAQAKYNNSRLYEEKKIFLIGTSDHDNIGDSAITLGTYSFIKRYFPKHYIIDISGYELQGKYAYIHSIINDDDLIFLQGGGNIGNMYLLEENIRRKVIADFPSHKIYILPQTIFFEDSPEGLNELKSSASFYNRHRNLTIFTRGTKSLQFAQTHFSAARCINALDMALMLERDFKFDRQGILLCLRSIDDESGMDSASHEQIHAIVSEFGCYDISNNRHSSEIAKIDRALVVNEELKKFASHRVIVTDRLHGMIFSVITKTPCVVMNAYTQKIDEFCKFFQDSNAVFYIEKDVDKLKGAIENALLINNPVYPVLQENLFDELYHAIADNGI